MPEDSSSIDYAMEKASGPHFSGLRFDGLLSSSPPNSSVVSSLSHLRSAVSSSSPASSDPDAPKQPFIIGVMSIYKEMVEAGLIVHMGTAVHLCKIEVYGGEITGLLRKTFPPDWSSHHHHRLQVSDVDGGDV